MSHMKKHILPFVIGLLGGIVVTALFLSFNSPRTDPAIKIGENSGRILAFDVQSWPTPNFLFQQEGRLPVVLFKGWGAEFEPMVTLRDGHKLKFNEFANRFNNNEDIANSTFTITYKENNFEEQGAVYSIVENKPRE